MEFILSWLGMFICFFVIQGILCFKVGNLFVKFVPAAIIALSYIAAFIFYIGDIAGIFPEGGTFAAVFLLLFSSADLMGCLFGWLAYYIFKKTKRKKK